MKFSIAGSIISFALIIPPSVYATCLQMSSTPGMCPVSPAHIRSIQAADSCHNSGATLTERAIEDCQQRESEKTSHHPLYGLFGISIFGKSPELIAATLDAEIEKLRPDIVDELGRIEFEESIAHREIDTRKLKQEWYTLRARATTPEGRAAFEAFKQSEDVVTTRRIYRISNPNEFLPSNSKHELRVYRPFHPNGIDMDIANMHWESLPDTVQVNGRTANLKQGYTDHGNRVYNEVTRQLKEGVPLADIKNSARFKSLNLTQAQVNRIMQTFELAGRHSQLERNGQLRHVLASAKKPSVFSRSNNRIRRLGANVGLLGLAGAVGVGVIQIAYQNQQECENAFPYTPVTYEQPQISGNLPPSLRCRMIDPNPAAPLPSKVRGFLSLPAAQIEQELNADTGTHGICAYTVKYFNSRFCAAPTTPRIAPQNSSPTRVSGE